MKNKKQCVINFQSLDSNNQLEIAEIIIKELELNEYSLDDDEYDKKKSKLLKSLFDKYIKKISNKAELLQVQQTFNRFNNLSDEDKQVFVNQVFDSLVNYCDEIDERTISESKEQELQIKREFCENNGHDFSEWKKITYTTEEELRPSGIEELHLGVGGTHKVKHVEWRRRCKYCGYVQTTKEKPQEIKEKEIKSQIKSLQKSLGKMKSTNKTV